MADQLRARLLCLLGLHAFRWSGFYTAGGLYRYRYLLRYSIGGSAFEPLCAPCAERRYPREACRG